MKIVKTTDELLALRGKDGVIRIEDDLRIECVVPWEVGKEIAGIYVTGNLYCGGNLDCRGNLYCRGNLDCGGEYFIVMGDLFWPQAHKPKLPEHTYIKRILPPAHQREHWQERLGMDISAGCYEDLCGKVLKQIINLLRDEKWTSTERWMLETLRDSEKPAPEWVEKYREERERARDLVRDAR